MTRPTEDAVERGRRLLRRQGLADAACILVAKQFRPGVTLADYATVLEISSTDIQAALLRRRGIDPLPDGTRRNRTGQHVCPVDGCDATYTDARGLASHRIAAHTPPVVCPNGCGRLINARGIGPHTARCPGPPATEEETRP